MNWPNPTGAVADRLDVSEATLDRVLASFGGLCVVTSITLYHQIMFAGMDLPGSSYVGAVLSGLGAAIIIWVVLASQDGSLSTEASDE